MIGQVSNFCIRRRLQGKCHCADVSANVVPRVWLTGTRECILWPAHSGDVGFERRPLLRLAPSRRLNNKIMSVVYVDEVEPNV